MKIDGTSMSPLGSALATNRITQLEVRTQLSGVDKVAVSDKAQVFQALLLKAKDIPSISEERVSTLAGQIERGEYTVDPQKIAEKLFVSE